MSHLYEACCINEMRRGNILGPEILINNYSKRLGISTTSRQISFESLLIQIALVTNKIPDSDTKIV